MNELYRSVNISKQAFHQYLEKRLRDQGYKHQLLFVVHQIREDHPTMGCRDMYNLLQPEYMGRDAFEEFCKGHGFASQRVVNQSRTTDSKGVTRFENRTLDLKLTGLNQVWVSDITYYEVHGRFYYLTFIMDAYSRRILGHHASSRLFTEQTTLPALYMAIRVRKGEDLQGTILHSDGGGQYYDKEFLSQTVKYGLLNSMCTYPWENGKSERVNGVIKNNYLRHRSIHSFEELSKQLDRAVQLYNYQKPHSALKKLAPVTFEMKYLGAGKHPMVSNQRRNVKNSTPQR